MEMEGVFDKLKAELEQEEWPNVYLFKFIVPNDAEHIAKVNALFGEEAEINSIPSRNEKYVSLSIKELMLDVESIINIYEKASTIKGLIAL